MATISFDEKVVVTNSDIVEMIIKDLEDSTPIVHKKNDEFTIEKAEENGRQWALKLMHSAK
ncbi:MAG: hypothetical protein IKA54_05430 [Clostridia bacterium]|jgi:hypothetical protein|nr:hypothetical protein [Clostridia bacterium]